MGVEKDLGLLCLLIASSKQGLRWNLEGVGTKASAATPSSSARPRIRIASCAFTEGKTEIQQQHLAIKATMARSREHAQVSVIGLYFL